MTRNILCLGALAALAACSTPPPDGPPPRTCKAQGDCAADFLQVCEDSLCSDDLPQNELQTLLMDVRPIYSRHKESIRAVVLYPITPSGETVACKRTAAGKTLPLAPIADLLDAAKYNQTSNPSEQMLRSTGDVLTTGIFLNGVGRVVYVEVYAGPISPGSVGPEGAPVGVGCLENAPFEPGAPDGKVVVKIDPA